MLMKMFDCDCCHERAYDDYAYFQAWDGDRPVYYCINCCDSVAPTPDDLYRFVNYAMRMNCDEISHPVNSPEADEHNSPEADEQLSIPFD